MKTSVKTENFALPPSWGKTGSLYVQFIKDRKTRWVGSKECRIYPEEWDEEKESFHVNTANQERKAYMETVYKKTQQGKNQLLDVIRKLESRFEDYNVDDIIKECEQYRNRSSLITYAEQLASRIEGKQPRTARSYRSVAKKINEFYGAEIRMDKIDTAFVKQFEEYILAQGNTRNTSSYYLRNLRSILNHAIDDKVINPFRERLFAGVFTGNEKNRETSSEYRCYQNTGNRRSFRQKQQTLGTGLSVISVKLLSARHFFY